MLILYVNVSPELTKVRIVSSPWHFGDTFNPWKCMLAEVSVILRSPQCVLSLETISDGALPGAALSLLVNEMVTTSPGLTCSVGDSRPSVVVKQNRVLPAKSTAV